MLVTREANGFHPIPEPDLTNAYREYAEKNPRQDIPASPEEGMSVVPASILGLGEEELAAFRAHIVQGAFDPVGLAWLLFSNVNAIRAIPWVVRLPQMIGACAVALLLGMLSALMPMRRIGRLSVVESIRTEE